MKSRLLIRQNIIFPYGWDLESSMLAIRPKSGELVWYFQFTPNDTVDYDGNNEPILTELQLDGKQYVAIASGLGRQAEQRPVENHL